MRGNINKLIKSYLSNRKQFVSINGVESEMRDLTCGVPQGSSLGPLLFIIYINDFRLCLDQTETGHFADDTYLLYGNKKMKTIETIVNMELKKVSLWLRLNKLSLNACKTELVIFHSILKVPGPISIKLDGKKLTPVDSVKYLGIYLEKTLILGSTCQSLMQKT